jgi:TM2 domain-containing membrane protein YozV
MTQGPDDQEQTPPPQEPPAPPPYGQAPPPPPPPQQGYPQQGYPQQGYPQAGYPVGPYGASPQAPYGIHPATGLPYSDKQKLVAGLLQILIPLGIGRFYIGDTKIGVWQLVVTILTCGIGGLWPFIDGIIILATDSKDVNGLPLRS